MVLCSSSPFFQVDMPRQMSRRLDVCRMPRSGSKSVQRMKCGNTVPRTLALMHGTHRCSMVESSNQKRPNLQTNCQSAVHTLEIDVLPWVFAFKPSIWNTTQVPPRKWINHPPPCPACAEFGFEPEIQSIITLLFQKWNRNKEV